MSGQGNLQFVWDIMLQSDWWKQYGEMIEKSQSWSSAPSSAETLLSTTSGAWWMEIPEAWWSSFGGSWWNSFPGSEDFGSGGGLGYGLQLI